MSCSVDKISWPSGPARWSNKALRRCLLSSLSGIKIKPFLSANSSKAASQRFYRSPNVVASQKLSNFVIKFFEFSAISTVKPVYLLYISILCVFKILVANVMYLIKLKLHRIDTDSNIRYNTKIQSSKCQQEAFSAQSPRSLILIIILHEVFAIYNNYR